MSLKDSSVEAKTLGGWLSLNGCTMQEVRIKDLTHGSYDVACFWSGESMHEAI